MDNMNKARFFFIAMFVLTGLIEFFVLRRWSRRWRLESCVASVSGFSGIAWMIIWMMIDWGDNSSGTEDPPSAMIKVAIVLALALIFAIVALIPASIAAFTYCKLKSDLPN